MQSLAGSLLVARPTLRDGFFRRAVILMLEHGDDGAIGLVLNKKANADHLPFPVFIGGPCKVEGLLMIHGHLDWLEKPSEAKVVCPGVYLGDGVSFERMHEVLPGSGWKFRVFTGYSGWGKQQLENEIEEGAWIVMPAKDKFVFDATPESLWNELGPSSMPMPSVN